MDYLFSPPLFLGFKHKSSVALLWELSKAVLSVLIFYRRIFTLKKFCALTIFRNSLKDTATDINFPLIFENNRKLRSSGDWKDCLCFCTFRVVFMYQRVFFTFCVVLDGSLNYSRLLNSCPDEALCQMLATDLCSSWIKYSIQDEKQQWYYTTPFTSAAHLKKQNDSSSLLQAWGFVAHTDPLIR